eukprot:gene32411-31029_t
MLSDWVFSRTVFSLSPSIHLAALELNMRRSDQTGSFPTFPNAMNETNGDVMLGSADLGAYLGEFQNFFSPEELGYSTGGQVGSNAAAQQGLGAMPTQNAKVDQLTTLSDVSVPRVTPQGGMSDTPPMEDTTMQAFDPWDTNMSQVPVQTPHPPKPLDTQTPAIPNT